MDRVTVSKNYYYDLSQEKLAEIKKLDKKPSLLLHSCCAPCNSYTMVMLSEYFELTLLYNNSNIFPESEYNRRFNELVRYTDEVNEDLNLNIVVKQMPYDTKFFHEKLKQSDDGREGGKRCTACFSIRMDEAYAYALEYGYDYFTTVMTISRHKNSMVLNQIGADLDEKYQSQKYFFSDFKKKDGLLKSKEIIDKYEMYRQQYCGCAFGFQKYLERENNEK